MAAHGPRTWPLTLRGCDETPGCAGAKPPPPALRPPVAVPASCPPSPTAALAARAAPPRAPRPTAPVTTPIAAEAPSLSRFPTPPTSAEATLGVAKASAQSRREEATAPNTAPGPLVGSWVWVRSELERWRRTAETTGQQETVTRFRSQRPGASSPGTWKTEREGADGVEEGDEDAGQLGEDPLDGLAQQQHQGKESIEEKAPDAPGVSDVELAADAAAGVGSPAPVPKLSATAARYLSKSCSTES